MSYFCADNDIGALVGKTLASVVQDRDESITFVADTGERWMMYYEPDCCASCYIEDVVGDLQDLVGTPIQMAEAAHSSEDPKDPNEDSFTWTFYKFATPKGYVTVRWYGSSNGYYSETASFGRVNIDNTGWTRA